MKKSLCYALSGIVYAFRRERNIRIHFAFAFYVILAGFVTKLSETEWSAVLICIALVIGLELLNTAVEKLCDTVHPDRVDGIKRAKDAAAGAVMVSAAISVAIGSMIFFNSEKAGAALTFAKVHPIPAAVIVLTLPMWIYIIFGRKK
ncbi:MAG: diacylglycerol kinase family protein [Oscillospiraceae bacterium]